MPANAKFPSIGTDLHVARKTDGAIGQGQRSGEGETQRMFAIGERAGLTRIMRRSTGNIRFGLMSTFLTTNPFGTLALIIMTVAGEAIAVGTERDPILVKAALETGLRLGIHFSVAHADGA